MKTLTTITLIIVTLILSGCGGTARPKDLPKLFPCTITITQDGEPLEGACIEFVRSDASSDAAAAKYSAVSTTGKNGEAVMRTYAFPGVSHGSYKVIVTKNIEDDFVYGKDEYGDEALIRTTSYQTIDPKFSSAETTPFEIEITGKDKNVTKTFDAGKAVKIKVVSSP